MVCIDTSVVIIVGRVMHIVMEELGKVVVMKCIVAGVGEILLEELFGRDICVKIVIHKWHVQHELIVGTVILQAFVGNGLTPLVHVVRWQPVIKRGK